MVIVMGLQTSTTGRKVGQIVSRNMVASASGPNVSSAYFDSSMAHTPIDYNFARA